MPARKQAAPKFTPPFGYGAVEPLQKAHRVRLFAQLDLLAPFSFQVTQNEAPALKLQGMHRIDEQKLKALPPGRLKALLEEGGMGRICAHIHSLENFARLYQRAVARAPAKAKAKVKARAKRK